MNPCLDLSNRAPLSLERTVAASVVGSAGGSASTRRVDPRADLQEATERNAREARQEREAREAEALRAAAAKAAQEEEAAKARADAAAKAQAEAAAAGVCNKRKFKGSFDSLNLLNLFVLLLILTLNLIRFLCDYCVSKIVT